VDETKKDQPSEKEEEISIDFSKIKQKFKSVFKSNVKSKEEHKKTGEEDISFDFNKVKTFAKSNAKWLIPLACILVAVILSVYLRTMPLRMPVTDDWAENTVYNYYKNGISNQIAQQYPNLPAANQAALVEKEWTKFLEDNSDKVNNDITQISEQYKSQFKDDNGTLYLLGIDPWHYYRASGNVLNYGHPGTTLKDGVSWDTYFMAPEGRAAEKDFHAYAGAFLHKFMNLFGNYPLMFTFFFVGVIFSALSVIPAFFIGRRITGNNIGGFFTAFLIAVASFFVSRTTGESSDTDVYVVFFPLLITWLFLEAFEAKNLKNKLIWISCAGISTGIFSTAWKNGWWYIFDFVLATIIIYLIYLLVKDYKNVKETVKSRLFKNSAYILGVYFLVTWLVSGLLINFNTLIKGLMGPFSFINLKAVAIDSLWPNIRTTVAELNVTPLSNVVSQLGGKLLFALAIVGIIYTIFKKDELGNRDTKLPIFLIIWFAASLYATTKGTRFILPAVPVFAIAFGTFLGSSWHYASQWIAKEMKISKLATKIVVFVLLCLLLIQPIKAGYDSAYNSVPSMNDAWYNTLQKINVQGDKNAIVNSWWDFGHWFKAIANRPVTFDGAAQTSWGAYWIGHSLLVDNEKQTTGILRMMNCGQNNAFLELDKVFNDTHKELNLLNQIVILDKEEAASLLRKESLSEEQIASVIKYTHCEAPTDYFITSDDMIGKAPVWAHFGSWDFEKAEMYQQTKRLDHNQAVELLTSEFNLTPIKADEYYNEIQSIAADQWIAPWPAYISGLNSCNKDSSSENKLVCNIQTQQGTISVEIDLDTLSASIPVNNNNQKVNAYPQSLVYADKEGIKEKKFTPESDTTSVPFSVILVPEGEGYVAMLSDPSLAFSTFTKLYFFEGHGMKCFKLFDEVKPFTGGKVSTWTVDYNCQQENKVFFLPKEEVKASHILISTEARSDEEAKQMIEAIRNNLTGINFADYAKMYSDDPGSKENGGELGWFGKGVMIAEFENTAFGLKIGEISEPFKTQFGWHVIRLEDRKAE